MGVISALLIFSKLSPAKDAPHISWFFIIFMILFIGAILLLRVYVEILIKRKSIKLTKNQIRMKKLKKLKRIW